MGRRGDSDSSFGVEVDDLSVSFRSSCKLAMQQPGQYTRAKVVKLQAMRMFSRRGITLPGTRSKGHRAFRERVIFHAATSSRRPQGCNRRRFKGEFRLSQLRLLLYSSFSLLSLWLRLRFLNSLALGRFWYVSVSLLRSLRLGGDHYRHGIPFNGTGFALNINRRSPRFRKVNPALP